MSEATAAYVPKAVKLKRRESLRIDWADGQASTYPLTTLRRACPCASCKERREKEGENPLRVVQAPADQARMAIAANIELVGNYALRIMWEDGHDTGIYDYRYLRELSPVDEGAAESGAGT